MRRELVEQVLHRDGVLLEGDVRAGPSELLLQAGRCDGLRHDQRADEGDLLTNGAEERFSERIRSHGVGKKKRTSQVVRHARDASTAVRGRSPSLVGFE
jgi:hypothetical protein